MDTRLVLLAIVAVLSLGVEAQTPSNTPATPGGGSTTCSTLQQIVENSPICSTGESCTQIQCTAADATTSLEIQPCETTPSVRVIVQYHGIVIYHKTFSHSEVVPIRASSITIMRLNITLVDSPNLDSMTLMVVALPLLLDPVTLIPATEIPISRAQCFPGHTTVTSSTTTTSSSSTDSPPPHPQTCRALQGIASASISQCNVVESCTILSCSFLTGYSANLTVLPCSKPPGVRLIVRDIFESTVINETLVQSRTQPVTIGGITAIELIINITHVAEPPAIILQISARSESLPTPRDIVIVPMTTIPIDYSSCPGYTTHSTDSTGGSTPGGSTPPGGSPGGHNGTGGGAGTSGSTESVKSLVLVEILVPVCVVSLLLVIAVVVVIVVGAVVYASKKRARAYTFHRMTFNNAAEEDEEEDE